LLLGAEYAMKTNCDFGSDAIWPSRSLMPAMLLADVSAPVLLLTLNCSIDVGTPNLPSAA
jgi:hypothetical protein